jgi:hypothetical protein
MSAHTLETLLQRQDRMRKSDVARYLGLNPKTVELDRENDDFPAAALRLGNREFWFKDQIDEWVMKQNPDLVNAANQIVSSVAPELAAQ